ncbi:zinc finger MYND domain-containing protein 15 isoform X2 [Ricinus communis]|uniref:zinc finger MYND domain-containing protein 15 isoform X2 n=1 Tax=Ricinus communis TaxID=3988 RepID=UPI0007724A24|nr:zinc finger MYND domain-containing protein 15 isoform X2 [Ricinus communis]|eukprot:XP_015575320.1 zinc finger MYND domain-containing protein 15 [Ricinus communis]
MECAAKGRGRRCIGPPTRRCARCSAVAYCSVSHQILHWSEHKEECERLEQQMKRADDLNDFPFTFTPQLIFQEENRCSFLSKREIHGLGMWICECSCGASLAYSDCLRSKDEGWNLSGDVCPCRGPVSPISKHLSSWMDYYEWRCIPLHSPVALLLHWPLTIYYATQVARTISSTFQSCKKLCIHYLGPEKELLQLAVFGELHALFPGMKVHVDLIGPAIPEHRDGQKIDLCSYAHCSDRDCICRPSSKTSADAGKYSQVTLQLHRGFYHDCYRDLAEGSSPNLVIAPNAGIAAYSSWLPTIELINEIGVPAVFSDYCEEACHLGVSCITSVTGCSLALPIQINPFRQPMVVEDSALLLPCYSNCFIFGM